MLAKNKKKLPVDCQSWFSRSITSEILTNIQPYNFSLFFYFKSAFTCMFFLPFLTVFSYNVDEYILLLMQQNLINYHGIFIKKSDMNYDHNHYWLNNRFRNGKYLFSLINGNNPIKFSLWNFLINMDNCQP